MTTKGQITVPKEIRELLHLRAGDEIAFTVRPREGILLTKSIPDSVFEKYTGDLDELRGFDVDEFMKDARGR
ncbi:MAG: AbrB/MazE/SpoVT family DNA-binding domain-containing protein [Chloroflexota bacterium]